MAKLALVYGLRILPGEELERFTDAQITLKEGRSAGVTMHVIDGDTETSIKEQLLRSIDAFFDFYPEIS